MKQNAGFAVLFAVALAAVRFSSGTPDPPAGPVAGTAVPTTLRGVEKPLPGDEYKGGCTAFNVGTDIGADGKPLPKDPNRGSAKGALDTFFQLDATHNTGPRLSARTGVRYAIALAPDPRHTNLSLSFDREMVALQQAAQDDGYTFDTSWLPWSNGATKFPLLIDQQAADENASHREACPGLLLFRKSLADPKQGATADPYAESLVVLLVGEQPTAGLNEKQWANAILWLRTNASTEAKADDDSGTGRRTLRILGPSFSGSLVSLERELFGPYQTSESNPDTAPPNNSLPSLQERFPRVEILSGGVSSCSSVQWFQSRLGNPELARRIQFGSFQENDELQLYRFFSYMKQLGGDIRDTAVLSEDETAYGYHPSDPVTGADKKEPQEASSCDFPYSDDNRPLRLAYPRDISALRTAYEKQSVFDGPSHSGSAGHAILQVGDAQGTEGGEATDTIRTFAGPMSAVAQEAVLYGAVSYLRAHHTRYLLLRCTNPLDFLFLTRFFHRAYPEVRIVTVGSDLLFRREIDTTEYRGVMALTNYPLLPMNQHWSQLTEVDQGPSHVHRVLESNSPGGTYVAARYLFGLAIHPNAVAGETVQVPWLENISDYADPFWLHPKDTKLEDAQVAPTWLSVVGRDGYWPVAVLNATTTPPAWRDERPVPQPPHSTLVRMTRDTAHYKHDAHGKLDRFLQLKFPLSWRICVGGSLLLLCYQAFGITNGQWYAYSTGLFSVFRRFESPSQSLLLGASCGFAAMLLLALLSVLLPVPDQTFFDREALEFLLLGVLVPFVTLTIWVARPLRKPLSRHARYAVWGCCVLVLALVAITAFTLYFSQLSANSVPLFYRMTNLTAGVSPLLPLLFLIAGMYLWTWQALAGNALLHCGRPQLPKLSGENKIYGWVNRLYLRLTAELPMTKGERQWPYLRRRLKNQAPLTTNEVGTNRLGRSRYRMSFEMGKRIVDTCSPVSLGLNVIGVPTLLVLAALLFFHHDLPLLGIEGHAFAVCFNLALLFAFFLTSCEAARLFWTWREFKKLLTELSRQRLRRTFAKLRAVDANSLWSVSGDVYRVQYHFFSQQLDAIIRLSQRTGDDVPGVLNAAACGREFARINAGRISDGPRWDEDFTFPGFPAKVNIRRLFADTAAEVFNTILVPAWLKETTSLSLENTAAGPNDKERNVFDMKLSEDEGVRAAEEFVCFQYIAFIQNILARMRTMVLSMIYLFLAVCFSISFYPFVPRTQIGLWMLANLLLIGSSVIYVYAGMERDETLSYIANTRPGQLSGEFWIKTAGFLAGPVIGLLTTQFPSIAESVLGWLQPGLNAIK